MHALSPFDFNNRNTIGNPGAGLSIIILSLFIIIYNPSIHLDGWTYTPIHVQSTKSTKSRGTNRYYVQEKGLKPSENVPKSIVTLIT